MPRDYVRGHIARMAWHKKLLLETAQPWREQQKKRRVKRLKRLAIARAIRAAERAAKKREEKAFMQARRRRTQKQGPYKAGATLKAKAAVAKIEAAMRRRG